MFMCAGWQVTLYDIIWQVDNIRNEFHEKLYTSLPYNETK